MQIKIRPYESLDYNYICGIHDAARKMELSLASLDTAFLSFSLAAEREKFFDYPHIDVATINDGVVAFSAYTDDELAWLYVSPDMMRNGIGRKLVARALDIEPGIKHIEALYGNEPARKLYESIVFFVQEIEEGVMPGNELYHVKVYSMCRVPENHFYYLNNNTYASYSPLCVIFAANSGSIRHCPVYGTVLLYIVSL